MRPGRPTRGRRHGFAFRKAGVARRADLRMNSWMQLIPRTRDALLALTLLSQLLVSFGYPLATQRRKPAEVAQAYPCQNRPCGCLSSEECWKGDCCCFTLEAKLEWAEANGIEPPPHVRPLVAARVARMTQPTKRSRCSKADQTPHRAQGKACTVLDSEQEGAEVGPASTNCPLCATNDCAEHAGTNSSAQQPPVRWVIGLIAQRCRGEGQSGLGYSSPSIAPRPLPFQIQVSELDELITTSSHRAVLISIYPPTPPPRAR
ncbi:hypothetical protein BH10PLA2_BH10PLA2_07220 [soil metagenome]